MPEELVKVVRHKGAILVERANGRRCTIPKPALGGLRVYPGLWLLAVIDGTATVKTLRLAPKDTNPGRGVGQQANQSSRTASIPPIPSLPTQERGRCFAHAYNFVPLTGAPLPDLHCGAPPQGHQGWSEGAHSAKLRLSIQTVTPLLTTEISNADAPWNVYSIRRDGNGRPIISGASIKGMLRSLYEVVTHSNFGVFSHDTALKKARVNGEDVQFVRAPSALLARAGLAPTISSNQLSPADRVFGWASQGEADRAAYRGHLRVGGVVCQSDVPAPTGATWQMATLGEPKPQQIRFYTRDDRGAPLHGRAKDDGYRVADQLAGYKVYPHQQVPDAYWALPEGGFIAKPRGQHPKDADGRYLKFLAAPEAKSDVSFAIADWVPSGVTFATTIYVDGVTAAELGALLWVLELPDGCYHKLGKGKPLGLGSVRVTVDWQVSHVTCQTASRYTGLAGEPRLHPPAILALRSRFDKQLRDREGATYRAVIAAARGSGVAHHYPWKSSRTPVEPQAKSYQWFVANEKGRKWALPPLETGELLPTDPS